MTALQTFDRPPMPIKLATNAPTLLIRRDAFERVQLTREGIDRLLNLTPDEFHVEGGLVAVGPIHDETGLQSLLAAIDGLGLIYFEEYFEMSGNWPEWLTFFASQAAGSRAS